MNQTSAFCYNKYKVKAIILGADPGNFSDHGKSVEIKVAFGIGSGDARYFDQIHKNLNSIGITLSDIYVQNMITHNPGEETSKNPSWEKIANDNLQARIKEFNELVGKKNSIPILVSAERILRFLSNDKLPDAETIYTHPAYFCIAPSKNKLGMLLYPFFRNPKYDLKKNEWKEYRAFLEKLFLR